MYTQSHSNIFDPELMVCDDVPKNRIDTAALVEQSENYNYPIIGDHPSITSYSRTGCVPNHIPLSQISDVGVSRQQAQNLNYAYEKMKIDVMGYYYKKQIDFMLRNQSIKNKLEASDNHSTTSSTDNLVNKTGKNEILQNLVPKFINDCGIVKQRYGLSKETYFYRSIEDARHIAIDKGNIKTMLDEYVESECPLDCEISGTELDRLYKRTLRQIATPKETGFEIIPDTCVVFKNGVYDLINNEFTVKDTKNLFNIFSLPYVYDNDCGNTDKFDLVLGDVFDNDALKIELFYEQLGAFLTPINALKKIFLYQGVSNAGKSRLANIICSLIGEDDLIPLDNVTDIKQDYIQRNAKKCRLLYIQELPDKKLGSSLIALLKSFTGNSNSITAPSFKILACTNYCVCTGDDGFLEPALKNRFSVLPFSKVMDNNNPNVIAYEDNFFEEERLAIIKKALSSFHKVLVNGKKFSTDFPINEVVQHRNADVESPHDGNNSRKIGNFFLSVLDDIVEISNDSNDNSELLSAESILEKLKEMYPQYFDNTSTSTIGKLVNKHFPNVQKKKSGGCIKYTNLIFKK